MSFIGKFRYKLSMISELIAAAHSTRPAMEIVYRDLFIRDLTKLGLEDTYYPVSGAANYGLLYLIMRSFLEFPIRHVLELGAGQSSILIGQLASRLNKANVIRTVEHDAKWATLIESKVGHPVHVAPLESKTIHGHVITHYKGQYFDPKTQYDFVLIDGPPADSRDTAMNRLGAIELVAANLSEDFIIIIDDAERSGESALVRLVRELLRGRDYMEAVVTAAKRQHVFAGGEYSVAAYF